MLIFMMHLVLYWPTDSELRYLFYSTLITAVVWLVPGSGCVVWHHILPFLVVYKRLYL